MGLQRVRHDWATDKQQQQRLFPDKIQKHLPWRQVWNHQGQTQQQSQSVYTKGDCKHMQLPENAKVVWYFSKFLIFHSHIFRSFRTPWESEMSEILSLKSTLWSLKIKAPNFLGVKKGHFLRYWNPNFGIRVSKSKESDEICVKEKCLESVNYILVLICWYHSLIYSTK